MEMRRRGDGKIQKRSSIRRSGKLTNKGGGVEAEWTEFKEGFIGAAE